jgi:DNA polymerase-3 subunit epsilon
MEKILWLDSETTGIDPVQNDIVQIAGIVEIDGAVEDEFEFKCRPWNPANINPSALETNKFTKDEIMTWAPPLEVKKKLFDIFGKYIDKFNREDKFLVGGHCVKFDIDFLNEFIKKSGDRYGSGSWLSWQPFDTMYLAVILKRLGIINPVNFKLESLYQLFNFPQYDPKNISVTIGDVPVKGFFKQPVFHDALADIRATREVGNRMLNMLKGLQIIKADAVAVETNKILDEVKKDITEGTFQKGGINENAPTSPRPEPPKSQGGTSDLTAQK